MRLLVRTWNVFHGRTVPPGRNAFLRDAVELVVEDEPDLVCLQEVPLWGVERLATWSRMAVVAATTRRSLPLPFGGARRLTDLHHRGLRSLLTGQANAVLLGRRLEVLRHDHLVLNDRAFRRRFAREHGLPRSETRAWGREPRVAQRLRLAARAWTLVLVNLHASHLRDGRLADAEILRAAAYGAELAARDDAIVLAGDFNARREHSSALLELERGGYSRAGPGIDHVLVRGAATTGLGVWPEGRRRRGGRLLSDHPPVELTIDPSG